MASNRHWADDGLWRPPSRAAFATLSAARASSGRRAASAWASVASAVAWRRVSSAAASACRCPCPGAEAGQRAQRRHRPVVAAAAQVARGRRGRSGCAGPRTSGWGPHRIAALSGAGPPPPPAGSRRAARVAAEARRPRGRPRPRAAPGCRLAELDGHRAKNGSELVSPQPVLWDVAFPTPNQRYIVSSRSEPAFMSSKPSPQRWCTLTRPRSRCRAG